MAPIIEARGLSCKMGRNYLIHDVTWQVMPGERWVVFGLNGSGKTTLLSIVAGYKAYTAGMLRVFGQEYARENYLDVRRRVGWVSGSFYDAYYTNESVRDIVISGRFGTLSVGFGVTPADERRARELLRALGVEDKIDHPFSMLSKGQRQNVMIARALFPRPEVLILDEPCSGLDVYNRARLFGLVRELAGEGLSIVYVTHYAEEIIDVFDRALLLRAGRVFAQGAVDELFSEPTLNDYFGYPVRVARAADGTRKIEVAAASALAGLSDARGGGIA